jgi:hypothetical protein
LKKNYSVTVLTICITGFLLTIFLLWKMTLLVNLSDYIAMFLNLFIVLINLWIGISIMKKSLKKENKKFLVQFFGSMIARLFLLLVYVLIALTVVKLPINSFIFSFFGFYFFGLIFEVNYLSVYTKINFKQI